LKKDKFLNMSLIITLSALIFLDKKRALKKRP
jgi:hypothetical protein